MKLSILLLLMSFMGINESIIVGTPDKNVEVSVEDENRGKNLVSVFEELTNRGASDLKIVLIKPGNRRSCRKNKVGQFCAEYATYSKTRRGLKLGDMKQVSFSKDAWNKIDGPDGHLFLNGAPVAMKYERKSNTVFIAKADIKLLAKKYTSMKFATKTPTKPVSAYVIPAPIYDFFGGDGSCCPDCYYVHRLAGLPCSVDAACCVGQCPGDPTCNDGGGGGSGGGSGGGGDDGGDNDDDGCGGQSEVSGASIMVGETECSFTGTVESVRDDGGSCVMVAVSGVISCDGAGGISSGTNTPAQTEGATGGY